MVGLFFLWIAVVVFVFVFVIVPDERKKTARKMRRTIIRRLALGAHSLEDLRKVPALEMKPYHTQLPELLKNLWWSGLVFDYGGTGPERRFKLTPAGEKLAELLDNPFFDDGHEC